MKPFTHFSPRGRTEPPETNRPDPSVPGAALISRGVSIKGSVKFLNELLLDGEVEGNIFVTQRCELQANCTVRGDIETPRLVVNENATFLGSAKVGTGKSLPA